MRRVRTVLLIMSLVSLLLGLSPAASEAQEDSRFTLEALVTGETNPPPNEEHSLGINRVEGESEFVGLEIAAVILCREGGDELDDPEELVIAPDLTLVGAVAFRSDDDITDGHGEVIAPGNAFTDTTATEVRVVPPGIPSPASVEVRILGGRFHRLGGVVEVDLDLDIRVQRADEEQLTCESDAPVKVRIVFHLLPDTNDQDPTSGFFLAGVARTHVNDLDRTPIARTICGVPTTLTTIPRVTEPAPVTTIVGPGRGPFHPCLPEGQQDN